MEKDVFSEGGEWMLFDSKGNILFHPNSIKRLGYEIGLPYKIDEELSILKENQFVSSGKMVSSHLTEYKGNKYLVHARKYYPFKSSDKFYGVVFTSPRGKVFSSVSTIRSQSIFLSLGLIFMTAAIGWFFTKYLMKNLNEITTLAKAYTQGEQDIQIPIRSNDEIGILALTFQGMVRQVNERTRILRKSERKIREARDQAEQALSSKSQLLEDIRRQKSEIERVSKDKDDLLAIVSHDLKNPLAVVETSMDILMENDDLKEQQMSWDLIRRSKNAAKMALNLITDLLDLARLEGGIKLDFEKFSVTEMIDTVIDSFYLKAKAKNINLFANYSGDYHVYADYGRCIQVISNIVGNALKFTPENGWIEVRVKTYETAHKLDGSNIGLRVEIQDNGRGIPGDKVDTIFNKFEQAKDKDREIGTGLGLAICKNICSLHSGDIWVESKEGQGATFIIVLPRILEEAAITPRPSLENIDLLPSFTVLVVDDQEEYRSNVVSLLKNMNQHILEAKNGEEGLQVCESQMPDLILLDLNMPVKNGVETLNEVRQLKGAENVPVIAMAESNDQVLEEEITGKVSDVYYKHTPIAELEAKVSNILMPEGSREFDKELVEGQKTILIVDDEDEIRELMTEYLEMEDYNVLKAKHGVEALFLFKKYHVDLVVTDLRMQKMDGITLCHHLGQLRENLPIIIVSGKIVELPSDLKVKLGAVKVMTKPFEFEVFVDEVKQILGEGDSSKAQIVFDDGKDSKVNIPVKTKDAEEVKAVEEPPVENVTPITVKSNSKGEESNRPRLLLVDDSDDMQTLFKILMRKEPYDIDVAENGLIGLEYFKKHRYQTVFMDINMPEMKGDEAIIEMRKWEEGQGHAASNIIVMTANDSPADVEKFLSIGFDSFVKKPLNKKKILAGIPKKAA
jgi:CheY-like chemotaxis protein/HAMP domain-containing protein